tara:strand:+ start:95 stop:793 length:699 start_codon:yes stop_codon:yes gene_type:complete
VNNLKRKVGCAEIECCTLHTQLCKLKYQEEDQPFEKRTSYVIDEVGTASLQLLADLLFLSNHLVGTYLVLSGDDKQLPSIDHGSVLTDLVHAFENRTTGILIPVLRLETIYRTDDGSDIATIAPTIFMQGPDQLRPISRKGDYGVQVQTDNYDVEAIIKKIFVNMLKTTAHGATIQMLTQTNKNCIRMNKIIQPLMNKNTRIAKNCMVSVKPRTLCLHFTNTLNHLLAMSAY